ncbi:MAG: hypothetical protein WC494_01760 [Candidatus Pacearchaeota archaeon]
MKEKNKFLLFIPLIILSVCLTYSVPISKEVIPVKFYLSNKTGFDLTPGILGFGAINPNQSALRTIIIENRDDQKVNIIIKASDEIIDNIIVSENNFYLWANESKTINLTIFTEGLKEFKEYNGKITILTKRAY